jgi:uncharacterized protein YqeY
MAGRLNNDEEQAMALKDRLTGDLKVAMKARDQVRLDTLRGLIAELKNLEIAQRGQGGDGSLGEADELAVLSRARKQRDESIAAFRDAGREELAANEEAQLAVLLEYLPKQLGDDEVTAAAREIIAAVGATSKKDMGKVMGKLMAQVKGRYPGEKVKPIVEGLLS